MKFCKYCGSQISDGMGFCPACGRALDKGAPVSQTQNPSGDAGRIAGILFAAAAVLSVAQTLIIGIGNVHYAVLVKILATGFLAYLLLQKRKDILLTVGFALMLFTGNVGFSSISGILTLLGIIGMIALSAAFATEYLPQFRPIAQKAWFVPPVVFAVSCLSIFYGCIQTIGFGIGASAVKFVLLGLNNILLYAAYAGGVLLASKWLAGVSAKTVTSGADAAAKTASAVYTAGSAQPEAYCDMVKHVLLLLFTFGIWNLIWVYRMTEYTNAVKDEEPRNPTSKLLLCMFVPFYSIYWTYKTAQRIDKLAVAKGLPGDSATLCLILDIFIAIVPPILMQDKMNKVVTAGAQNFGYTAAAAQPPEYVAAPAQTAAYTETTAQSNVSASAVEELKQYKGLLDAGIITQEEFDAKKKQILGL